MIRKTQSGANVGSHAFAFKSLHFGLFTQKHEPGVFGVSKSLRFQGSKTRSSVDDRRNNSYAY